METTPKTAEKPQEKEPEINMDEFRAEIAELIIKAWKERDLVGSDELKKINQNHLNKEDAVMWNKVKNYKPGSISIAELKIYEHDVIDDVIKSKNDSRRRFCTLITKMLEYIHLRE